MILSLATLTTALAADPRVEKITWAQPFELAEAHPYRHTAAPRDITTGWLVQLAVDPATQRPGPIVPGLWIGDTLAVRTNWDHQTGCSVVWVPGAEDLRTAPVFFGSTTLPERMDAERSAAEHADAAAKGYGPVPVETLERTPLKLADFGALMAVAADRVEACSPSDDARLPALRGK